jgi:hypothetical protein
VVAFEADELDARGTPRLERGRHRRRPAREMEQVIRIRPEIITGYELVPAVVPG